jgi:hypothetical protein
MVRVLLLLLLPEGSSSAIASEPQLQLAGRPIIFKDQLLINFTSI